MSAIVPEVNFMHVSDRLNNLNDLSPKFEGFFLEMVMPGQKQRVQEIVTEAFGLDWNVEQNGRVQRKDGKLMSPLLVTKFGVRKLKRKTA